MGASAARLLGGGDDNVKAVEVDAQWILRMSGGFQDAPATGTAREAIEDLREVGVDVEKANDALEVVRLVGPSAGRTLPADTPVETGLKVCSYAMDEPAPIYRPVSALFNSEERAAPESATKITAAMKWQRALDDALVELPQRYDYEGDGYRGMRFAFSDVEREFPVGKQICWYVPKSCATEGRVMNNNSFCGMAECRRTIFVIRNMKGKKIRDFSPFPREEEVLLRALTFFEILGVRKGDHKAGDPFQHADEIEMKMLPIDPPPKHQGGLAIVGIKAYQATDGTGFRNSSDT
eukprot:TRINITY_DN11557_c0_g1_i1.p1 TRINITY_DN11557_c0_g1~~TRINITY_DN11557_c0_g1_i1.p1  ORF type:complete len:306 (+),score=57.40 TRINITY_DN11557_c0_g1_i1:41-919(+)